MKVKFFINNGPKLKPLNMLTKPFVRPQHNSLPCITPRLTIFLPPFPRSDRSETLAVLRSTGSSGPLPSRRTLPLAGFGAMAAETLGLAVKAETTLVGIESQSSLPAQPPSPLHHPAVHPWLFLLLPLLLLLKRSHRSKLKEGWDWMGFTFTALLAPLRSQRNVIHDRRYLDQMLQAEAEANPEEWQGSAANRDCSGLGGSERRRPGKGGAQPGSRRSGSSPSDSGD